MNSIDHTVEDPNRAVKRSTLSTPVGLLPLRYHRGRGKRVLEAGEMAPLPPRPRETANGKPPPPPNGMHGNCLLSSALWYLPPLFLSSPHRPLPTKPPRADGGALVGQLCVVPTSLASAAERWVDALGNVVAGNGVLAPLFGFPANFRRFCQMMHCRKSTSPSSLSAHNFAAILPGDSVAGLVVANGLTNFLNIYNTLLIARLVLTWFPNAPPAVVSPLSTLCDPYLNIFRGLIPPLGGALDLSPILAFLVLNAFTSTAAALPAELPVTGRSPQGISARPVSHPLPLNLTAMQEKWMKRVCCKRCKDSKITEQTTE